METIVDMARRDVEQTFAKVDFAAALRQLAEALEQGRPFAIAVDGRMVVPPLDATLNIEHERSESEEELEFQLKWSPKAASEPSGDQTSSEPASDEDLKQGDGRHDAVS